MRKASEIKKDLRFNNSSEGNFHKTVQLLKEQFEQSSYSLPNEIKLYLLSSDCKELTE